MYKVYIIKSINKDKYYVGFTKNLKNRLKRHNSGSVRSTKSYRPWKTVYSEEYDNKTEARKRELQIKSWKSKTSIEKLINQAPSSNG